MGEQRPGRIGIGAAAREKGAQRIERVARLGPRE
jgi:hypothetical protein